MTYNYKCKDCKELSEVEISMADITSAKGRVDVDKMDERIYGRKCHCEGLLQIVIPKVDFSIKEKGAYDRAQKMAKEFEAFE